MTVLLIIIALGVLGYKVLTYKIPYSEPDYVGQIMANMERTHSSFKPRNNHAELAETFLQTQRERMARIYVQQLQNVKTTTQQQALDTEMNRTWANVVKTAKLQFGDDTVSSAIYNKGYASPRS